MPFPKFILLFYLANSFFHFCDAQQPRLMLPVGHTGHVTDARFSSDGSKIFTYSKDNTVKIWESAGGKLLFDLNLFGDQPAGEYFITPVQFSPDGTKILSVAPAPFIEEDDGGDETEYNDATVFRKDTIKIWDPLTGELQFKFPGQANCVFSPDNKKIAIVFDPNNTKIFDLTNGKLLKTLTAKDHANTPWFTKIINFSPDGKKLITASEATTLRLWDIASGKHTVITRLKHEAFAPLSAVFSPDNKRIAWLAKLGEGNIPDTIHIIDAVTGMPVKKIQAFLNDASELTFSPDGRLILVNRPLDLYAEQYTCMYDAASGKEFFKVSGACRFSPDGTKFLTVTEDSVLSVRDALSGVLLFTLKDHVEFPGVNFSKDSKKIITIDNNHLRKIWDATTGNNLGNDDVSPDLHPRISPDASLFLSLTGEGEIQLWDILSGKQLPGLSGKTSAYKARFSEKENKIILTSDEKAKEWDIASGIIRDLPAGLYKKELQQSLGWKDKSLFSPDGKRVLIFNKMHDLDDEPVSIRVCEYDPLKVDTTGNSGYEYNPLKTLATLKGHNDWIWSAGFSHDGKYIVTASRDNTIKIWDANSYKLLFTFFVVNDNDFLVVDKYNRYDGTEGARKLLYFVCGAEIIELGQVKSLWTPNLAERLINGEMIGTKTLDEIDICGLTPEIDNLESGENEYRFTITPRRGGLGETILYVNGIEEKKYSAEELKKKNYALVIKKDSVSRSFMSANENRVSIRAYTANNAVSSPESVIRIDKMEAASVHPNFYAVMVGVSDYKGGEDIDLNYSAIDAIDVSATVAKAARNLLNTDGKEHVFVYNLSTGKIRDRFPEKENIRQVLEEVGKKATADDILFIFLSGHGVVESEKKQFYFMTADAISLADEEAYGDVGISTAELTEWIKPQNIKAQKRILILDACNSGQAINDFVKLGNNTQGLLAARGDDKAQQIKAIDKLNEKSGLYILSASASNKSAFEAPQYEHGFLTYSLLKAIKQQPDILEDGKYLNVGRWFNAAGNTVNELAKEWGLEQQTQIVTTTDFSIGLVDPSVIANIRLPEEKLLFTASNFQNNDVAADGDDLDMSKIINQSLQGSSSKEIIYAASSSLTDAYSLSGRYDVKDNAVTITVNIKKNNITLYRFEKETGTKDKLRELADKIVTKAVDWAAKNK